MLSISLHCMLVLGISGVTNGIWFGILDGILDALPFIETGIVLIPLVIIKQTYEVCRTRVKFL